MDRTLARARTPAIAAIAILTACGPSLEIAHKDAEAYNARSRTGELARSASDAALVEFQAGPTDVYTSAEEKERFLAANLAYAKAVAANPQLAVKVGIAVATKDQWLSGCLFSVNGEIGFVATCAEKDGRHLELHFYRRGGKTVILRLDTRVVETRDYENPRCLQSGLSGGAQRHAPVPPVPHDGRVPNPKRLIMLGVHDATEITLRDARYPIKVVNETCTGTYETLGYPP